MATYVTQRPELGPATPTLIELVGVEKVYRTGKLEYRALRGVDLSIAAGEMLAIAGPSGSGKSTIINMITGIDRPTAGTVTVGGERIDQLSEEQLASWRGHNVGIVFQFFQLLPTLTALESAVLPSISPTTGPSTSGSSARRATSSWLGWATSSTISPPSCRAVSSSGSPSHARSRAIRS